MLLDDENKARLANLKIQFSDHYFDRMAFVPALEPIPSNWADDAKAKIDLVDKQYIVNIRASFLRLSRISSRILAT